MGFQSKVNQANKQITLEKYQGEPIWKQMEKVMTALREFYKQYGHYLTTDESLRATIDSNRVQFEEGIQKIEDLVLEERRKALSDLDQKLNRMRDKKVMQLELLSMQQEYRLLKKAVRLKVKDAEQKK